ncbi:hypothetical protein MUK42_14411 [Musa troglodytarum]|uniref:Jacalin-type lectin domain-containing protein n=1 Tax=Musa troglodytarum TaxID=320322 RepID=A0A9E7LD20_9LILI|nr:hypothetical protein MUK42_14411 [Musa troglodytarum]
METSTRPPLSQRQQGDEVPPPADGAPPISTRRAGIPREGPTLPSPGLQATKKPRAVIINTPVPSHGGGRAIATHLLGKECFHIGVCKWVKLSRRDRGVGTQGSNSIQITLNEDEHFTSIKGYFKAIEGYDISITQLTLTTDKGRKDLSLDILL